MRRFTVSEKRAGEMAVRSMNSKAQEFYDWTDPLNVYEYTDVDENDEDITLYAISGSLGDHQGMMFDELEKLFENEQEECERLEVEYAEGE